MVRYIKKVNDKVVECTGDRMRQSWYADNGYIAYEGTHPIQHLDIVDGVPVEMEIPPPPRQSIFTRYQIRTACRALDLETKLDALIVSNADFALFWSEVLDVDLNNEMTQAALAVGAFTSDEIEAVISHIIGEPVEEIDDVVSHIIGDGEQ